jgi:hypothetical protein
MLVPKYLILLILWCLKKYFQSIWTIYNSGLVCPSHRAGVPHARGTPALCTGGFQCGNFHIFGDSGVSFQRQVES